MVLLILGILLWIVPHMFKRLAPAAAARMDETRRKMIVSLLSLVSLVLMVIGFRAWDAGTLYVMPGWTVHLMALLMVASIYLLAAAGMKTRITRVIRHPQLTGVTLWALAHLLVNGDWASILLFGSMLLWAQAGIRLENAQTDWVKPPVGPMGKEIGAVVGTVIVTVLAVFIHKWLGHPIL